MNYRSIESTHIWSRDFPWINCYLQCNVRKLICNIFERTYMYATAYNYCITMVKKNQFDLRGILYCYFEKRNSKKNPPKIHNLSKQQQNKHLYHKIKQNKFKTFQNSNKTNNFSSCDYSHWDLIMKRHMPLLWSMLSRFR